MLFKSVSLSVFATLVIMVPLASVGQSNADAFSDVSLRAENEIQQGHLEAGMAMLKAAADAGDASAEYGLAFHLNGNGETTHYMISSASHGFALARVALARIIHHAA